MTMSRRRIAAALMWAAGLPKRVLGAPAGGASSTAGRVRRAAPVIVIFVLLTVLLEQGGWMRSFESSALDTFLLLKEPLEDQHVVIVGITKDDYAEYFGRQSPLNPARLEEVLGDIADGNPAVVGVDLDTSSETFRGLPPPPSPPAVVWARDAERVPINGEAKGLESKSATEVGEGLLRHFLPFVFKPEEERFSVSNVLGRGGNSLPNGVALLPRDSDGAIRRYRRRFETWEPDVPVIDSFPWAVVQEYRKSKARAAKDVEESEQGWVMDLAVGEYAFKPISINEVLEHHDEPGWRGERGPLKGKVVLLGALYPESRDRHYTPAGTKYGVELLAYAVESELQGRVIKPPSKYTVSLAGLAISFVLVLVHARFGNRPKHLRYTIVAIPLLALLASLAVFSTLALWATFLPTTLAVLFQQLHEDVQQYRTRKLQEIYEGADSLGRQAKQALLAVPQEAEDVSSHASDGGTRKATAVSPAEQSADTNRQ